MHKGLICSRSKYFQVALNGSFSEASGGVIELPEDDAVVFEIVHAWLYSNKIRQNKDGEDVACTNNQIVDLFVFGDTYDMPTLCNQAVDNLIKLYLEKRHLFCNVTRIYNKSLPGSPLRRVLLATWTDRPLRKVEVLGKNADNFQECPVFLSDLSKALVEKSGPPKSDTPQVPDPYQYHFHAEGEVKCT